MTLEIIFSPITIGGLKLKNRIVMAPMGTNLQGWDGSVNDALLAYFQARARGGAGLIISPFTDVSEEQRQFSLGVYSDRLRPGLNRLAETVQAYGAKFFLQIAHYGGRAAMEVTGKVPIAPSSISSPLYRHTPRELTVPEIKALVEQFAQAARRAKLAGCDGIELHGAHTYLVGQFISPHTNRRDDEYGGDFTRRMRFVDEIIAAIREVCGEEFPIGFKFSAYEHLEGGVDEKLALQIAAHMERLRIAYLHVASTSSLIIDHVKEEYPSVPSIYTPPGALVGLAERVKKNVKVPVIATGGISDPEYAEQILREGWADMVALGRALLADPDWPRKAARGEKIRPCIRCNICHTRDVFQRKEIRCTVNPSLGREREYKLERVKQPRRVVVVGAGPGGLEAALVAAARGHRVTLYEAKDEIGGQMRLGSIPPFKRELARLLDYYREKIEKSAVDLRLEVTATADLLLKEDPEVVILAVGAEPIIPHLPGATAEKVFTVIDLYEGRIPLEQGERLLVLGAGPVGSEAAWFLALQGHTVTLVDILPEERLLAGEHPTNRAALLAGLHQAGVKLLDRRTVAQVEDDKVLLRRDDGALEPCPCDRLILAVGLRPRTALRAALEGVLKCEVYAIGDCVTPRNLFHAIHEGAHVGREI
jgi:2,4-dienoyl-CoA reductase-like NADH-dependent reductase (Old Yellow Enzyme family)/thioredoxin reductase